MSNWRDEQRETNRNNSWNPADGRRPNNQRIAVGKHVTGKKSLFMVFLSKEGHRRFSDITGQRYDQQNDDHKRLMTELYQGMDPENRQRYKNEVDTHNNNPELVSQTKHERDLQRRTERHSNTERAYHAIRGHRDTIMESRMNVPASMVLPLNTKNIHVDTDLAAHCAVNKEKAARVFNAYIGLRREEAGNPLTSAHYVVQLISVFPIEYTYKPSLRKLSSFPAEIAITTFHLTNGVIRNESRFVYFDQDWFYGDADSSMRHAGDRTAFARRLGIPVDGPARETEPLTPDDAFRWLEEEIKSFNPAHRVVCDMKQYNYVYYGIKQLALYTGLNATRYFQDVISSQLLSIQDYTSIILESSPLDIPRSAAWSSQDVNRQLANYKVVPLSDRNLICEFHENKTPLVKYTCVKAHNARLLHNFYHILEQNLVQDVHNNFSPTVHELCICDEDDPHLQPAPEAQTITRAQELSYLESETPRHRIVDDYSDRYNDQPSTSSERLPPEEIEENLEEDDDFDPFYRADNRRNDNFISRMHFEQNQPERRARDIQNTTRPPVRTSAPSPAPSDVYQAAAQEPPTPQPGKYKPFGVMPRATEWERPVKECVFSWEDSEYYYSKSADKEKHRRMFTRIELNC